MVSGARSFDSLQSLRAMRPLAFVLGCVVLIPSAGCHYWQPEPAFPQRPAKHAEDVRVTLRDSSRVFIRQVTVTGDSLIGGQDSSGVIVRRAIPLTDIRTVEGRMLHSGRTSGLAFGIGLLVALGLAAAAAASMGSMNMGFGS